MNCIKKYVVPVVIVIGIFVLLTILRTVPVARLWKGFSVLYVPVKTKAEVVFDALNQNGCKDVISYYNQRTPFFSEFLPIAKPQNDSYLSNRNAYFFDKERTVMIYYIPEKYSKNAQNAVKQLISQNGIDAGLDSKSSFPLFTPLICVFVSLLFLIFSKHRLVFLLGSIFPIIFTFAMPFYTNAAAVCISLYSLYLAQFVWLRKGSYKYLFSQSLVVITFCVGLVTSFFASFVSGLMFVLSIVASFLLLFMLNNLEKVSNSKKRFTPVLIRPAKMMNVVNEKSIKKLVISLTSIIFIFVLYITSVNVFSISNSQYLYFPLPTSYNTENSIPTMNDYVIWSWNSVTMPYRSVNSITQTEPVDGMSVCIQRFINTENGIKQEEEVVYTYNQEFRNEVINSIEELNYPAIEKLMKSQDKDFYVDYSSGAGEKFSKSNIILLLVLIILSASLVIINLNGQRKNGNFI